ncbi:metallophosphoesterase [Tropicimonas sp. IMCC34043]|uniref:metallophosphoesterase family protein n=1 Tax=Tropicimonas sp. IMCC34043 TaxID=2248760 RepID=UPI000E254C97|nr:metallophosphoesterase family protein [Tropicimonas sp. IMCC34043]
MSRILHLSDLHFGRERPELEAPLLAEIDRLAPDLVAISGDFTQRARISQFERARAFLGRIGARVLAVPGNHDTPLDNLFVRMLWPWARYRAAIARDLEPRYCDDRIAVVGVNTVNRFAWQRGRISSRAVGRVCAAFEDAGDRVRILVLHHPLEHGPDIDKRLMRGARGALAEFESCGADLVLSGHLHNLRTTPFAAAPGLLFVQAGTGLSTRLRGEPNTFNLLDVSRQSVRITTFGAESDAFETVGEIGFYREGRAWRQAPSP